MKIIKNALITLSVFLVVAFSFALLFKDSYAISDGVINNTLPSGTWTSNYSGSGTLNYIGTALGTNNKSNNFITYKDYKINNSSIPLYSYMKNLSIPTTKESITVEGNNPEAITDKGMLYIISHGYNKANPNNNIFSTNTYGSVTDNNIKQYITQIALWLYMYENKTTLTKYCIPTGAGYNACDFRVNDSTTLVSSTDVRNLIKEAASKSGYNYLNYIILLVDNAKTYSGEQTSKMNDINYNNMYTVNETNKYIITDTITPSVSSNKTNFMYYEVELSDPDKLGAYITDINGNKLSNTSVMNGSFRVYIPFKDIKNLDLSKITIKVGGHFIKNNGYGYTVTNSTTASNSSNNLMNKYNDNKYQKYSNLLLGDLATEVNSVSFKLDNFTKISKIDITTGKELPGATLEVTNKETNEKITWVSTDTPHYLKLEDGNYTLCETLPPKNYKLPDGGKSCIDFAVDNSKVTYVKMENAPIPNTGINKSYIIYAIGIILVIFGISTVIYVITNNKKREA